jgi:hypothetical protein
VANGPAESLGVTEAHGWLVNYRTDIRSPSWTITTAPRQHPHNTLAAMPPATQPALIDLLEELLSTPCTVTVSESSVPIEYRTTTLLLRSARTATIPQLIELILHILLSQPPFTYASTDALHTQRQRFFAVWTRDNGVTSSKSSLQLQENALTASVGLSLLSSLRPDFQRLGDSGFRFVSELLLSCLQRLSPEGAGGNQNIRGWVEAHGSAVTVLSELLHSIPTAEWLKLDEQAECALPVWKCLQLLSLGAVWWGGESSVYRESLLRLARCVCAHPIPPCRCLADGVVSLPCSASLLRVVLRVDLKPPDVHSIVTTLLAPLERRCGISTAGKVNAFTPTPYKFPTMPALDRHDFSRDYEFANLRVMFVAWINGEQTHRRLDEFKAPWDMQVVLQHTEAYKKLKAHPESAVRVALTYIFNEAQNGCQGRNWIPSSAVDDRR